MSAEGEKTFSRRGLFTKAWKENGWLQNWKGTLSGGLTATAAAVVFSPQQYVSYEKQEMKDPQTESLSVAIGRQLIITTTLLTVYDSEINPQSGKTISRRNFVEKIRNAGAGAVIYTAAINGGIYARHAHERSKQIVESEN